MGFETSSSRSLIKLYGIVASGMAIFAAFALFGLANPQTARTITEETTITYSLGGKCVVDAKDSVLSAKTISGCDLPVGTKVTVSYKKGLPEAQIVSQPP